MGTAEIKTSHQAQKHFHVICCPYCFQEVEAVECDLSDCGFPFESKRRFLFALVKDCPHCGQQFFADFGITPKQIVIDRIMEFWLRVGNQSCRRSRNG